MLIINHIPFQSIICYCKLDNGGVYYGYGYIDKDGVSTISLCHKLGHTIQLLTKRYYGVIQDKKAWLSARSDTNISLTVFVQCIPIVHVFHKNLLQ